MSEPILGIDLGTTNTVAALFDLPRSQIVPNSEGARTTPSIVAIHKREVLVGMPARRQAVTNPENTVHSIKRLMGRTFSELQEEVPHLRYRVVAGPDDRARIRIGKREISPEEVSAHVLRQIKENARRVVGKPVRQAVITVPANFNDMQRQATRDAGRLAGLDVRRIINEPTAAVLAYGMDRVDEAIVLAYDFGGGTFDVSILEIRKGLVTVLATAGEPFLGGDDIDWRITEWLASEFARRVGVAPADDAATRLRLLETAERAKVALSSTVEVMVRVPFLATADGRAENLEVALTRARLESMIRDMVAATITACKRAMADARLRPRDIQESLLVGGSARIPLVRDALSELLGREPKDTLASDEIVAMGAAVQGGILSGEIKDMRFRDVLPVSLGIQTSEDSFTRVVPRNTPIPTRVTRTFSTARDDQEVVGIHVVQGEREVATRNASLGRFSLKGLSPMPRGKPRVEIGFGVDADGILHVSALERDSGSRRRVAVRTRSGLDEKEIERILRDAEKHREHDERAAALAELRNLLDGLVVEAEALLSADALPAEARERLDAARAQAQEAFDTGRDPRKVKAVADQALKTLQEIRQAFPSLHP
jgi:molecular chaperone DnaK